MAGRGAEAMGWMTSSVQFGFIAGTLLFAFFALSDRHSPVAAFFACSLLGAWANLGVLAFSGSFGAVLTCRFLTGFFLAGVYPVGMKIAASWYEKGLGRALGYLVGALVLGTALPHLLKGVGTALPWQGVLYAVSGVAAAGGFAMWQWVPNGPYHKGGAPFDPRSLSRIFASRPFRASAFGYFGHMWELYAFWTFVPFLLAAHARAADDPLNVSVWAFAVIGAGAVGCAVGGIVSHRTGSAPVAAAQLGASGLCCLASPFLLGAPTGAFLAFLVFWGVVVVGDSPQFSALNAAGAPRELVGSALTIANSIGFAITVVSIQCLAWLSGTLSAEWLMLPLAVGPVAGLVAMRPLMIED
jgi:predicted MFS family arabinose efflux permease